MDWPISHFELSITRSSPITVGKPNIIVHKNRIKRYNARTHDAASVCPQEPADQSDAALLGSSAVPADPRQQQLSDNEDASLQPRPPPLRRDLRNTKARDQEGFYLKKKQDEYYNIPCHVPINNYIFYFPCSLSNFIKPPEKYRVFEREKVVSVSSSKFQIMLYFDNKIINEEHVILDKMFAKFKIALEKRIKLVDTLPENFQTIHEYLNANYKAYNKA